MKMPMATLMLKRIVVVAWRRCRPAPARPRTTSRSARRPSSTSRWIRSNPAVKGPDGVHLETFDVAELFEHAGARRWPKSARRRHPGYELLLQEFPGDTKYRLPSLYNEGLAYQAKKDWGKAAATFKKMAGAGAGASDTKDALFQLGATYAEMGNWPTSATIFARAAGAEGHDRGRQIEASRAAGSRSSS